MIAVSEEIPPTLSVLMDSARWLKAREEFGAASRLLACELKLEPSPRQAGRPSGGLDATVVCPSEVVIALLDDERSDSVMIREAIEATLPEKHFVAQLKIEIVGGYSGKRFGWVIPSAAVIESAAA